MIQTSGVIKFPNVQPDQTKNLDSFLNCRIELNDQFGTIKYCGKLIHKTDSDVWAGIEWDDSTRGKHSGTVEGYKYFETKSSSGGSLVKLSKLNVGLSFFESVKFKYDFDNSSDEKSKFLNETAEKQSYIESGSRKINIEFVGKDKASKKFSSIDLIECIDLSDSKINSVGSGLNYLLPNVKEIILTKVMFNKWSIFVNILTNFKNLTQLNFSENYHMIFDDEFDKSVNEYESSANNSLTSLIMNRNNITTHELSKFSFILNKVKSLYLYGNRINSTQSSTSLNLNSLSELSLENNSIIDGLSVISYLNATNLTSLNLNNNLLEAINFSETNLSNTLESLFLDGNKISSGDIFVQLQNFKKLKHLYIIFGNPYFTQIGLEVSMKELIGRLLSLKILNNNIILKSERKEYEVYFLKKIVKTYFENRQNLTIKNFNQSDYINYMTANYPSYLALKSKYFDPLEDILHNMKMEDDAITTNSGTMESNKNTTIITQQASLSNNILKLSFIYNDKTINKNIPKSTTFLTIRSLVSKLMKIEDFSMFVYFNNIEQKIIDEGKSLEGYDIISGTSIYLK